MRNAIPLDRFLPEWDALTRAELVHQYAQVEKARARERLGRGSWVDRVPTDDGRIEVRRYEQGRLVDRRWEFPAGSAHKRTQSGVYGSRLA